MLLSWYSSYYLLEYVPQIQPNVQAYHIASRIVSLSMLLVVVFYFICIDALMDIIEMQIYIHMYNSYILL